jgi:tRNA-specific 2-thiouridylase
VADYFIAEYKNGRTPNPDVMCNKHVKFGAFLDFAKANGADYIATGHYAQKRTENEFHTLYRGSDTQKDQSYFLWTLTQEQLAYVLLPVGDSPKSTIRKEAAKFDLITADKKDSQGVCFLGHIDIPDFLSHYIPLKTGNVLSKEGAVIGSHRGAFVYTTGQRHGFTIFEESASRDAHFVTSRDMLQNTITVDIHQPRQEKASVITLSNCNFIGVRPKSGDVVEIQTRYRQQPVSSTITAVANETLTLSLGEVTDTATKGQSCVLYSGTQCKGGGIIV